MNVLPLVERELRVAARRRNTYRVRWWMAGLGLLLCLASFSSRGLFGFLPWLGFVFLIGFAIVFFALPLLLMRQVLKTGRRILFVPPVVCLIWFLATLILLLTGQMPGPSNGFGLFRTVSGCVLVYCLLAGVFTTADSVSCEKREGTIGFLFLSNLKGYDVVLGKLAAKSLNVFYGVLSIFPVLALAFVLGGVSAGEFWRMVLALISALFFSLACGMFVSTLFRAERAVGTVTLLILGALAVVLPAAQAALQPPNAPKISADALSLFSPYVVYQLAFDSTHTNWTGSFFAAFASVQGLSWGLLALACGLLPRAWQETGKVRPRRTLQAGEAEAVTKIGFARRFRWLDRSPVAWLVVRDRWLSASLWLAALSGVGLGFLSGGVFSVAAHLLVIAVQLLLKLCVVWEISRLVSGKWKDELQMAGGTLLTEEELVHGLVKGVRHRLTGPVIAVLTMELLLLLATWGQVGYSDRLGWAMFVIGQMVLVLPDLLALAWLALAQRPMRRNSLQATAAVAGFFFATAGLVYLILFIAASLTRANPAYVVAVGFAGFLVIDLWLIRDTKLKAEAACRDMLGRLSLMDLISSDRLISEVLAKEIVRARGHPSARQPMPSAFYDQFNRLVDSK